MKVTIQQAVEKGIEAHRRGMLEDAKNIYLAILSKIPNHPQVNHNLGLIISAQGNKKGALRYLKNAVKHAPTEVQMWHNYIKLLLALGEIIVAREAVVEAKQHLPNCESETLENAVSRAQPGTGNAPPQERLDELLTNYNAGLFVEAENIARNLSKAFPKHFLPWKVLGVLLYHKQELREAENACRKAAELATEDPEVHNNLGICLQGLGRNDEAEIHFRRAILLSNTFAEAYGNLAVSLIHTEKLAEAEENLRIALELNPSCAEFKNNLGITLSKLGREKEAEKCFKDALEIEPRFYKALNNLGSCLRKQRQYFESEKILRKAISIFTDYADAHGNLGATLHMIGQNHTACEMYRRAIELKPENPEAYNNVGVILLESGDFYEARNAFLQAIKQRPSYAEAYRNLSIIQTFTIEDPLFSDLKKLHGDQKLSEEDSCHLCFATAKAYDDVADYLNAFKYYEKGNELRRKEIKYRHEEDRKLFWAIKNRSPRIREFSIPVTDVVADLNPIFIVGMPRSGTTLVEQIVSSHGDVTGAGELPFVSQFGSSLLKESANISRQYILEFRRNYLSALQKVCDGKRYVTDKMPLNFRYLGLLHAALPEAKIIHVKRDPAATCWSNYERYFPSEEIGFCYNLRDITGYYRLYQDLMSHWGKEFGQIAYNVHYEDLTLHQEREIRKLINYVGLTWDESCLSPQHNTRRVGTASLIQVRGSIYQGSSEKWKRYQPYTEGLLEEEKFLVR